MSEQHPQDGRPPPRRSAQPLPAGLDAEPLHSPAQALGSSSASAAEPRQIGKHVCLLRNLSVLGVPVADYGSQFDVSKVTDPVKTKWDVLQRGDIGKK